MFEGVIAGLLNRFLGKYVQDLDTENLNVGIFSGNVNLTDLKLKPEALYEFNLPIDVKIGTIGRVSFQIPWQGFSNQPVVVQIQDVLLLVGPAISNNFFDAEREKRLIRAAKKKILEDLETEGEIIGGPQNFFENLLTTIVNNIQIFIRNIHIRYEDTVSCKDGSLACGLCLQSLSIETTNNKWKPSVTPPGANIVYQMMKMESLSFYWNPNAVVLDDEETQSLTQIQFDSWRHYMITGLEKFSMHGEDFEFLLKPVTCKVKFIINRSGEARVPRLLVDTVLQDSAAQISRKQYLSVCSLVDSFKRISINRKYRHLHPKVPVTRNTKKWWKYFYNAVIEQRVKPYTWQAIKSHRENYHRYKNVFKMTLRSPNDTELKLDLQKCEDNLAILSIIIAREHAKIELHAEEPLRIDVRESEVDWWRVSTPSPIQDSESEDFGYSRSNVDLCIKSEKAKGLWSHLSSPEKKRVCELIGYVEGGQKTDKSKLYIEHKINFTLANLSLSLVNRGREILVLTLTQFLASIETRPAARAFKVSARAESIVIEGANAENDLAPMVTADNIYSGNTNTNFLSIDFEKNPLGCEADFGLNCSLEPVEVVYNEHAISEIINFFQTRSLAMKDVTNIVSEKLSEVVVLSKSLLSYTIARHKIININMDLKGPYIILPESGSLHKGGQVIVVDLGRVVVKSDLQPLNNHLEDATCMELEERLYDRLYADCSAMQVFFCDSGDEWRNARKLADSDFHLIPKIRVQLVFSNSIKQDYKLLPKHKLNITISSIKLNLSDRRIGLLMEFFDNLPLPTSNTVPLTMMDSAMTEDILEDKKLTKLFASDKVLGDFRFNQLASLKRKMVLAYLYRQRTHHTMVDSGLAKKGFQESEKSAMSVDHSDEDVEIWARTVDLPGFDDNVSPNNNISVLLRFVIGEAVLHLSRSLDSVERPYMMLRFGKVCVDVALMKYGPALQFSLQSLMLSDKLHQGTSGEYLELITTDQSEEVLNILYRKIRADCPDFKSHFHSVEQSLVVDVGNLFIVFHQEAWQTLAKYMTYIIQKVQTRDTTHLRRVLKPHTQSLMDILNSPGKDAPIPPGATKFSYSFRLSQLRVKFSHSDSDIMDVKIGGLESDCVFKANERMILKAFLNTFTIDDLSDMTLYSKMLWVEEDKVLEMKYVRHTPRVYRSSGKDSLTMCDDVKSDGSLKIYVGRLNIVLLYKLILDMQNFLEPFIPTGITSEAWKSAERNMESYIANMKCWQTRIHISIEVHAPVFLLPQKSTSPNLIVFNSGDLTVENFFKEINPNAIKQSPSNGKNPVIDNMLVQLDSVTVSRAVITLAGSLEVQEPILEPVSLRFDIKRALGYHNILVPNQVSSSGAYQKDILLYDVSASMETVCINLGQRDLSTLLSVWSENLTEGRYVGSMSGCSGLNTSPIDLANDSSVKKLQAFLSQTESMRKEAAFKFTLDGVELKIFADIDEVLSSPVRDCNTGLAKMAAGELSFQLEYMSDGSLDVKSSLQSLSIEDIRPDTSIVIKKMFQSHAGEMRMDCSPISVSTPPIVDLTFRQNQAGDRNIDVHIEKTRLNFSVPFFMSLGRFILDALPGDKSMDGGVINHGYVGDNKQDAGNTGSGHGNGKRPPSAEDYTSGYFSTGLSQGEEATGLSISIQCRKPEIMFFSDLSKTAGHALLFRTEILIDYSRHSYRENFTLSLSGLQILSKLQSKLKSTQPYLVLHPCDIEFTESFKNVEEGIVVTASVSPIDMHVTETTVRTITDIIEDITTELTLPDEKEAFNFLTYATKVQEKIENEEMWTPKKTGPYMLINVDETNSYTQPSYPTTKPSETFTLSVPSIRLMFELEAKSRIPILMAKSVLQMSVHDWSKQMHGKCEFNLQASYYNDKVGCWEPLIEPVVCEENVYRPCEVLVKIFQAKSYPISCKLEHEHSMTDMDGDNGKYRQVALQKKTNSESETSADENEDAEDRMTFISQRTSSKSDGEGGINLAYSDDYYISSNRSGSDSENEDGAMEKLASAISHLFTGDSSDGENSESDESSGAEPSGVESDQNSDVDTVQQHPISKTKSPQRTFTDSGKGSNNLNLNMKADSVDSGLEAENMMDKTALYIMIESRDVFNVTLTSQSLHVLYDLMTHFTQKTLPVTDYHNVLALDFESPITLVNDIGPGTKVDLVTHAEQDPMGEDKLLASASYDKDYSCPSSPANSVDGRNTSSNGSDHDWETFEGGFNCELRTPTPQPMFSPSLSFPLDPVAMLYRKVTDERLLVKFHDFDGLTIVCPQRAINKLHALQPIKNNTRYYIMLNTDSKYQNRKIVLRSPLQLRNETSYAIGLFYKKADLEALNIPLIGEPANPFEGTMRIHVLEPDETYNIPLYVAYHCKLYLQPTYVDNYHVSGQGLWWRDLSGDLNTPTNICCLSKDDKDPTAFSLRVFTTEGCRTNKTSQTIPNNLIRLLPPLTIHNRLPYAVEIKIPTISHQTRIEAGEKSNIYHLNMSKVHRISVDVSYLGLPWSGGFNLNSELEEKTLTMSTDCDTDGGNKQLGLNVKIDKSEGCDMYLHAPYWIINKTGLPLQLRGSLSDVVYECVGSEPLLFQYRRSMRRRRVRLRVYQSSWSSAFGLETVGAAGLIICKHHERNRRYRILMTVSLSQLCPQLTRIITLLPYFLVTNETKRHLRFMEENERADLWIDLAPGQCVAFWPETDSMKMHCKFRDSTLVSQHFSITKPNFTVLRMDKGSALCVDVSGGTDKPFTINFQPYRNGDAPVRIDNICEDIFLKFHQKEAGQVALLSPNQSTLYTWDDPTKERQLFWNVYNNKGNGFKADFFKDGFGEERVSIQNTKHTNTSTSSSVTSKLSSTLKKLTPKSPEPESSSDENAENTETSKTPAKANKTKKSKITIYWVSYLDNHQRVFMVTHEERLAYNYRLRIDSEKCNYEMFLSMSGLGLSLCMQTSMGLKELSYLSLTDSPTKWEVSVAHKWKMLTVDLTSWIEEKFKSDQRKCQLKDHIHIDFDKMQMTKPFLGELKRTYNPALWMQIRKSDSQTYLHLKLHRFQIDNQLYEAVFPSVLYPAPFPANIVKKIGSRPCVELFSLKRNKPTSNHVIYKYIKLIVQEFCIQLDRGFVNHIFDILNQWTIEEKPALRLRADLALVHAPITNVASKSIIENTTMAIIEYLHLSPLKINLSLSSRGYNKENVSTPERGGRKENRPKLFNSDLLEFLFNSWSSCLTEMKGVQLKMSYFEMTGKKMSTLQLYDDAYKHFYNQLIQQFYVLVLGLDILGNPYGTIRDFTRGLGESFYEPCLAISDGPEEIATRLSFGASSIFGHSVGGVIKSSTLLGQSVGELMNILSFDDEFKKKRRFGYCLQKSSDLPESLILASQTYIMGVALGLSGIIMKPFFDGEQNSEGSGGECVGGVIRGCGGALSVSGGASLALGALRRAADRGRPLVLRARLPRNIHPYEGIKPYSIYQALGLRLLASLGRGHYVDTDTYLAHAALTTNARVILLLTIQHVFLVRTGNTGSPFQVEWSLRMDDVIGVPTITGNKLMFNIKQDDSTNYYSNNERIIECDDVEVLKWLQAKVESALILNMEDRHCPSQV